MLQARPHRATNPKSAIRAEANSDWPILGGLKTHGFANPLAFTGTNIFSDWFEEGSWGGLICFIISCFFHITLFNCYRLKSFSIRENTLFTSKECVSPAPLEYMYDQVVMTVMVWNTAQLLFCLDGKQEDRVYYQNR